MKIRQGNAFILNWEVTVDGGASKLSELNNITVELKNPIGHKFYPEFTVSESTLTIPILIKYQKWTGTYNLSCIINKDTDNQVIVDCNDCFEIVDKNSRNVQYVSVTNAAPSHITLAMNGLSAYEIAQANGFEGTEAEWLESLHATVNTDEFVTKVELDDRGLATEAWVQQQGYATQSWVESKKYLTSYTDTIYDDTEVKNRLAELESIDHSKFLTEHQSLDGYATEKWVEGKKYLTSYTDTVYDDTAVKNRLAELESIDHSKYLTEHQSLDGYATQSWVESKKYLTSYTDTIYDDTEVKNRLAELESIDHSKFLTEHQSLDGYAKTEDLPTEYDDTEVKNRLTTLEETVEGLDAYLETI